MNYRENLSNYIVFLQSTGKAIKEQFFRTRGPRKGWNRP